MAHVFGTLHPSRRSGKSFWIQVSDQLSSRFFDHLECEPDEGRPSLSILFSIKSASQISMNKSLNGCVSYRKHLYLLPGVAFPFQFLVDADPGKHGNRWSTLVAFVHMRYLEWVPSSRLWPTTMNICRVSQEIRALSFFLSYIYMYIYPVK